MMEPFLMVLGIPMFKKRNVSARIRLGWVDTTVCKQRRVVPPAKPGRERRAALPSSVFSGSLCLCSCTILSLRTPGSHESYRKSQVQTEREVGKAEMHKGALLRGSAI